jgi:hypothetical protein
MGTANQEEINDWIEVFKGRIKHYGIPAKDP